MMVIIILCFLFYANANWFASKQTQVSFNIALSQQSPYTPQEPLFAGTFVKVDTCCYIDGPQQDCIALNPFVQLSETSTSIPVQVCQEGSANCPSGSNNVINTVLVVVSPCNANPPLGNCSVILNRLSSASNGFDCQYKWGLYSTRNCGEMQCFWDQNTNTITTQCYSPDCVSQIPPTFCDDHYSSIWNPNSYLNY